MGITAAEKAAETSPLLSAAFGGDVEAFKELLSRDADVEQQDHLGRSCLHYAAAEGQTEIVKLLLQKKADINKEDNLGRTALQDAAAEDHADIVEFLLHEGADVNRRTKWNRTPLHDAVCKSRTKMAELLINKGADTTVQDKWGKTPMHYASEEGCLDMVKLLLRKTVGDIDVVEADGRTSLHFAAKNGDALIVEQLLEHEADIDKPDKEGRTPLHYAISKGNEEAVKLFIQKGADANKQSSSKKTPLHAAVDKGNMSIFNLLMAEEVDASLKDNWARSPLHYAAAGGLNEMVEPLLKRAPDDINQQDKWGKTPLYLASCSAGGNARTVELLLENRALLNTKDDKGRTPFDVAKNEDMLKLLYENLGVIKGERLKSNATDKAFLIGEDGGSVKEEDVKIRIKPFSTEKNLRIEVISTSSLVQKVKTEFQDQMFLHPQKIRVLMGSAESFLKPVEVLFDVQRMLPAEVAADDGDFVLLRREWDEVSDMKKIELKLKDEAVFYKCSKFCEHWLVWIRKGLVRGLKLLASLIEEHSFNCKICPSATLKNGRTEVNLFCHSGRSEEILPHTCDDEDAKEILNPTKIKFTLEWNWQDNQPRERRESNAIKIDKKSCSKKGQRIEMPSSHIDQGSNDLSVTVQVENEMKTGFDTVLQRRVQVTVDREDSVLVSPQDIHVVGPGASGPARHDFRLAPTANFHRSVVATFPSVARIKWSNGIYGTGFRVGQRYLLTNYHVVEEQCEDASIEQRRQLRKCTFGYDRPEGDDDQQEGDQPRFSFAFAPDPVKAFDKDLDYAILECLEDENNPFPAPLTNFKKLTADDIYVHLVGHPGGREKIFDGQCQVVHMSREELDRVHNEAREWSLTLTDLVNHDSFPKLTDQRRALYHTSKNFVGGSSGSPGFTCDNEHKACVSVVHVFQFPAVPEGYVVPSKFKVEQGIRVEHIYRHLRDTCRWLCEEVFPNGEPL